MQSVTSEVIKQEGLALGFSENAIRVLEKRYLVRNEAGEIIETPRQLFERVSNALAGVERNYGATEVEVQQWSKKFFDVMTHFEFIPGGRTLTNAGGPTRLVSNCIVLHFKDSMDSIFTTLTDAALLQQAGSGLGFAWHLLRPAGWRTARTRGVASGPVSFLNVYNQTFGVIKQQGRHGANMGVMRVDHPDILEFINCKKKEGDLVNFNISVSLTDEFMKAVKEGSSEPWMCEWNGVKMKPRIIKRNKRGHYVSHEDVNMTARELMDIIVEAAWSNGEPGVLFPDAANRFNPVPALGRLESTNPCGEQWLHDGDVCNLGSINLAKFVRAGVVDEVWLKEVTRIAVRLLDNVIDMSDFPVEKVSTRFRDNRRIGLGIMGFSDMLYQLHIPYNSPEGVATATRVMKLINDTAHDESETIARAKGVFPNWEISIYGPRSLNRPQRNAALTTVAPTGSISMFADCASGIEPFFALAYKKENIMGGDSLNYVNPHLEVALQERGLYSKELLEDVANTGTIQHHSEIPLDMRRVFVTSMDINADDHIKMQAAFQKHVDNSMSKTINFPNSATQDEVRKGYILAWELGCKGCTVYRDGSRDEQVLNLNSRKDEKQTNEKERSPAMHILEPRPRPDALRGTTYKTKTAYGTLFVTINEDESGPFEVFSTMGKAGGFFAANLEALCRMISIALRSGVHIDSVIDQLKGIRDPQPIWVNGEMILSLPDAIGLVLERHMKQSQNKLDLAFHKTAPTLAGAQGNNILEGSGKSAVDLGFAPACPECGSILVFMEGCARCNGCGFSRCG